MLVLKVMGKFRLKTQEDVRTAIRRRGAELAKELTDKEIFCSESFYHYAFRLLDFILRKHKLYRLSLIYDASENGTTAFTDGNNITVNAGNILVRASNLLERRFKVVMGLLFHESAHKLFMDFDFTNKAISSIRSGTLFGSFETNGNTELEEALAELKQKTASTCAPAVAQLYHEYNNIINDGHDESAIKDCFQGFIAECIVTMDDVQKGLTPSLNQMIAEGYSPFAIYTNLLLEYCVFHSYVVESSTPEVEGYLNKMAEWEPTIDSALFEHDCAKRWDYMNLLILQMWPYIRDVLPDPKDNKQQSKGESQESSGAGGTGNAGAGSTGNAADAISQMVQQLRQNAGMSPCPQNGSGTGVDPQSVKSGGASAGSVQEMQSIAASIAEEKAVKEIQKELDDAMMETIRNTNQPLIHLKTAVDVKRHFEPNPAKYEGILERITPYLRNLIRQSKEILRDMTELTVQHHRRYGPIIEANAAYRHDGSFFAKKKQPIEVPDMAIVVLQDISGSMAGRKTEAAIEMMILLERFANAIGVPIMIATHNVTRKNRVNLGIYTDFTSAMPDKDRYSLAGITTSGCNRDGVPIRVCCEMLAKRPERVKLMFVISDGAPYDDNYSGTAAREDISQAVTEYRRKGLTVFGAAIDKDRMVIEQIYGDNFISIENLSALPKTLVRIIRKNMTV